ncbi:translation initiation factor IF-2-like [Onychostruthus taczanowskii]|uniref:translation initiation factor IF-2-like n=1 Tax=Onychostruthus taczanowskii TaxID=356909 RepID=UPI001B80B1F6|nr:translation initiation factor IF-2-like [Onychostruthus taczanowskii]
MAAAAAPQPGSPRQQRPPPAVTRQDRRCPRGKGPLPGGGCEPSGCCAALPACPGPGGGKRRRTGERSAPRPWLLPAGAKSRVRPPFSAGLPGGAVSSGEGDPTAREEMRLLPAQVLCLLQFNSVNRQKSNRKWGTFCSASKQSCADVCRVQ